MALYFLLFNKIYFLLLVTLPLVVLMLNLVT